MTVSECRTPSDINMHACIYVHSNGEMYLRTHKQKDNETSQQHKTICGLCISYTRERYL